MTSKSKKTSKRSQQLDRVKATNKLLVAIGSTGRRFFHNSGDKDGKGERFARFELDLGGKVWFVDDYNQKRIYTHYTGRWKNFSHGGTLKVLVERLRDWILLRAAYVHASQLGPWPKWCCDGDLWGYGSDMENVRRKAAELGVIPDIYQPPQWVGDLNDDCTGKWAGLTLRAEAMEKRRWWWCVYDHDHQQVDASHYHCSDDSCRTGKQARAAAEKYARKFLADIAQPSGRRKP